jgi:plasmid replication initiation protein
LPRRTNFIITAALFCLNAWVVERYLKESSITPEFLKCVFANPSIVESPYTERAMRIIKSFVHAGILSKCQIQEMNTFGYLDIQAI